MTPPLLAKPTDQPGAPEVSRSPLSLSPMAPGPIAPAPLSPGPIGGDRVEPAPVAISAVSHVVRAVDAAPTGTSFPDSTSEAGSRSTPPPTEPDVEAPRRRLPLLLGAGALTIGLLLGLVGALLRGGEESGAASPGVSSTGAGTPVEPPVTPDGDVTGRPDPDLRVVLRSLEYDGVTLRAAWTDPTDGEGEFDLLLASPDFPEGLVVGEFPPGQVSEELTLTNPLPLGKACFYMVVSTPTGGFGVSDRTRRCPDITPFGFE